MLFEILADLDVERCLSLSLVPPICHDPANAITLSGKSKGFVDDLAFFFLCCLELGQRFRKTFLGCEAGGTVRANLLGLQVAEDQAASFGGRTFDDMAVYGPEVLEDCLNYHCHDFTIHWSRV